jgi:CHASE2 domain-containing sensor protein
MMAMAVVGETFSRRAQRTAAAVPAITCALLALGLGVVAAWSPVTPVMIILGLIALCSTQAMRTHAAIGQ